MLGTLLFVLSGLLAGIAVVTLSVSYLSKRKLKELAEENRSQVGIYNQLVVERLERGDVSRLDLGIFKDGEKTAVLKITADDIEDDISEGDVIYC